MRKRHYIFLLTAVISALAVPAFCQDPGAEGEWLEINSINLIIRYQPEVNLRKVERLLRRRYFLTDFKDHYSDPAISPGQRIAYRLEAVLSRVEEILGMYPKISGFKIKIYKDRKALAEEYKRIFKFPANHKSFYIHKIATVFSSQQDISDSVVAHEFGHAVIDHYFKAVPPSKVAELLATYVDAHLED